MFFTRSSLLKGTWRGRLFQREDAQCRNEEQQYVRLES